MLYLLLHCSSSEAPNRSNWRKGLSSQPPSLEIKLEGCSEM